MSVEIVCDIINGCIDVAIDKCNNTPYNIWSRNSSRETSSIGLSTDDDVNAADPQSGADINAHLWQVSAPDLMHPSPEPSPAEPITPAAESPDDVLQIDAAHVDALLADAPIWLIHMIISHWLFNDGKSLDELADTSGNIYVVEAIVNPLDMTYVDLQERDDFNPHADEDVCRWINIAQQLEAPNVFEALANIHQISCSGCCATLIQVATNGNYTGASAALLQHYTNTHQDNVTYMQTVADIWRATATDNAAAEAEFEDVPVSRAPFNLPKNTSPCDDICVICQEPCSAVSPHNEADLTSTALACKHNFHTACIRLHYDSATGKPTCPSCRADIAM
jgi:hypothetical protein